MEEKHALDETPQQKQFAIRQAVSLASEMYCGTMSMLEGTHVLASRPIRLLLLPHEWAAINDFYNASFHLPRGVVREHLSSQELREKDAELAAILQVHEQAVREACRSIMYRLRSDPLAYSENPYKSPQAEGRAAKARTDWRGARKNVILLAGPSLMVFGFVAAHALNYMQPTYVAPAAVALFTVFCFWAGLLISIIQLASFLRRRRR